MASAGSSRRHVPFWGHQLAEYALAAALIVVGLHVTGRTELVLALSGAALAVLSAITKGPLAALRIVPKRLHLVIDLVLAASFFASPLYYLPSLPPIPIIISEAVAVVLVRMSFTTEIVPAPRPERRTRGRAGAPAPIPTPTASSAASPTAAAVAGRLFGSAVSKARDYTRAADGRPRSRPDDRPRTPARTCRGGGKGRTRGGADRLGAARAGSAPGLTHCAALSGCGSC